MNSKSAQPVLRVDNLCFRYPGKATSKSYILQDISFHLFRGETLGVVGTNGAGKSTLLRLLTGVMDPTSGSIVGAAEVRCGLLSLGVGFMADLTGADNVVISLMLQGFSRTAASKLLPEIQEFSELGDAFNERVRTYSAGMRSRLMFSAALHTRSDILLIDEVLSVGDVSFRKKARAALTERIKGDQTVVYVSHSEATVRELCHRTLWLERGRVQAIGATDDVLELYAQSFDL